MDIAARITDLKAKLRARDGKSEYARNVEAIKDEIARLEAQLPPGDPEE